VILPEEFNTEQVIGNDINTDPICSYNPQNKKKGNLFKDEEAQEKFD